MLKSTIENKHKAYLKKYEDDKNNLDNINKEIDDISFKIENCNDFKVKLDLESNLFDLIDLQNRINNSTDEIDYLLKVVPILNAYNNENEQDNKVSNLNSFVNKSVGKEKGVMYNEFMSQVENIPCEIIEKIDSYICTTCNLPKIISANEALMICPVCGTSDSFFDMGINTLSYEQEINSEGNITFAYKRINHFNEWLAQFQAKESTDIPQDILDHLRSEFHKNKITNTSMISKTNVKSLLKKLKYNKYYEHTAHITNLLTGKKPPNISPDIEEKLRNMFRDIQIPFEEHKPKNRSNFLSYSYCLYKFCELLSLDELLPNFPLLKSREKLHQQDIIWKKICESLNWQYIATV